MQPDADHTRYLNHLAKVYPSPETVAEAIINLQAQLNLSLARSDRRAVEPAHGIGVSGVVCVCPAMPLHHRGNAPRDQRMEMAIVHAGVFVRACLCFCRFDVLDCYYSRTLEFSVHKVPLAGWLPDRLGLHIIENHLWERAGTWIAACTDRTTASTRRKFEWPGH